MVIFYKKWKKYNEIQLTKNKMDLNIRKMTNHSPSPHNNIIIIIILSCLTSLDSCKPIQKKISVNNEGLSTPITT